MTSTEKTEWRLRKFDDLSPHELYALLQLRNDVFVVEQNCVFQDADNKDQYCYHFMGWQGESLAAYTRIAAPGVIYEMASIGRVATSREKRGAGLGRILMEESIRETFSLFGKTAIHIGAQLYLIKFYNSLGFAQSSSVYLEDGIEHIEMIRPAPNA